MKNTLFILLALSVAAPAAATDDDKAPEKPAAVEVLALEKLPLLLMVPTELDAPSYFGERDRPARMLQANRIGAYKDDTVLYDRRACYGRASAVEHLRVGDPGLNRVYPMQGAAPT